MLRLNITMSQNKVNKPAPWFPLSAHEARRVIAAQEASSSKGNSSKPLKAAKKIQGAKRKKFCLLFIHQLNNALIARATEEEHFWKLGAINYALAQEVTAVHKKIIHVLDQTLNHKSSGAPPTLRNAKSLTLIVENFKIKCTNLITAQSIDQFRLAICLHDLCDDVEHYVIQISRVFGIVSVVDEKPVLSNRPTNFAAKKIYDQIITTHQSQFGVDNFPMPREIQSTLSAKGHQISKRTINFWKSQFTKKRLENFIQPQKRQ